MPGMGPERRPVSSGCSAPGKTRRETRKDPERPGKARYHFVQSDLLPPASMLNRYIYYALLRAAIAQINVKLSLRCAECMLKQDSQNCTSQSVHPDYPYCALACMLLYVCNNYGPMVYLVVFLHYVPCALST